MSATVVLIRKLRIKSFDVINVVSALNFQKLCIYLFLILKYVYTVKNTHMNMITFGNYWKETSQSVDIKWVCIVPKAINWEYI